MLYKFIITYTYRSICVSYNKNLVKTLLLSICLFIILGMRQSKLFGKTLREAPKDEVSANAKLLERGGFSYKTMAGVYDYLPLGLRVLKKIKQIIREEMDAIGGQELLLTSLQPKERWEKTGRWEELGKEPMYQFKDHSGREIGLASTHEEALAEIGLRSVQSYKDLPLYVYQIQNKFRDELRAKSGLIRGREFLMKDLYSFHGDEKDLNRFYQIVDGAYKKIFKRCGLEVYVAEASGGAFTKEFTHEYQVFSEAGEDIVFYCLKCRYSQNREIATMKDGDLCPKCKGAVKSAKSIEVGNIFNLGTEYSSSFGLLYSDDKGAKKPVVMGSYGIGLGRLMAAVVETHHDERGIMWPEAVAPFKVHLVSLGSTFANPAKSGTADKSKAKKAAEKFYKDLLAKGIEVLYDDRDERSAGEKFADADLIGIPWRAVISEKTLAGKGIEVKKRNSPKIEITSTTILLKRLAGR